MYIRVHYYPQGAMKSPLTKTQERVFDAIVEFIAKNGFPPTIREIKALMGYGSMNNVQRILRVLEERGYIKRTMRGGARCIEVKEPLVILQKFEKKIPLLGEIAAGEPIVAEENIQGYVSINQSVMGFDADFLLRVKGDSMIDANINPGDFVFVRQTQHARNGDIIVALLDNEATVKYFFDEQTFIRLQPANEAHRPITISKNDLYFKIIGKVEAVIHKIDLKGTKIPFRGGQHEKAEKESG